MYRVVKSIIWFPAIIINKDFSYNLYVSFLFPLRDEHPPKKPEKSGLNYTFKYNRKYLL